MTQPPVNPAVAASINLRGAVDLSVLKNARPAPVPAPAASPDGGAGTPEQTFAVDVTEANFQDLVQISGQVPVVVSLGAGWSAQSAHVNQVLEALVAAYAGRVLLGRVDAETSPTIAQAFGATAVPTVVALVKGQPVPLFEGDLPQEQVERFLAELLKVAAANGVDGALGGNAEAEPEAKPLPPLHQAAFDAIESGDLAAAEAAYTKALAEMPADGDAKIGLAQVQLMRRTAALSTEDADVLRRRAADDPDALDAQLGVADLDVTGGHIEDAFARIVGFIKGHFGPERETARVRLLELFAVVGVADPRVAAARQALARALF
ncbi:tetratricopeptide repeat protein [Pseudarthrobacter sp. P1]|uniref:tetratricopeptide repeat protein n=1 Tax=Pseudarthrobacter sp. P1 TaxID=3418418 RepID=UPI003CFBA6BA